MTRFGWTPSTRPSSSLVDLSPDLDRWHPLNDEHRPAVSEWFARHDVDEALVPLTASIALDPDTREWRFETHRLRDGRPFVDPATGEVAVRVLRRRMKSLPPWFVDELARRIIEDSRAESSPQVLEAATP